MGENKVERVLAIYQMLTDGESVNKENWQIVFM